MVIESDNDDVKQSGERAFIRVLAILVVVPTALTVLGTVGGATGFNNMLAGLVRVWRAATRLAWEHLFSWVSLHPTDNQKDGLTLCALFLGAAMVGAARQRMTFLDNKTNEPMAPRRALIFAACTLAIVIAFLVPHLPGFVTRYDELMANLGFGFLPSAYWLGIPSALLIAVIFVMSMAASAQGHTLQSWAIARQAGNRSPVPGNLSPQAQLNMMIGAFGAFFPIGAFLMAPDMMIMHVGRFGESGFLDWLGDVFAYSFGLIVSASAWIGLAGGVLMGVCAALMIRCNPLVTVRIVVAALAMIIATPIVEFAKPFIAPTMDRLAHDLEALEPARAEPVQPATP